MTRLFASALGANYQTLIGHDFPEHHFKSAAAMTALFEDVPEAIANTIVIAKRCSMMAILRDPILPPFQSSDGRSEAAELTAQADSGLRQRLERHVFENGMSADEKETVGRPYFKRLMFELDVIKQMGFPVIFSLLPTLFSGQKCRYSCWSGPWIGSWIAGCLGFVDNRS